MTGKPQEISEKYKGFDTSDAILDAAERLVGEHGPTDLKLREIARSVGIKPASIYNHFNGLNGIMVSIVERALADQYDLLDLPDTMVGHDAIRELCRRTTVFMAAREGVARLILNDFAEVHINEPNAFDENESKINSLLDREAEVLQTHLGLKNYDRRKLGQIALCRIGMTILLLSLHWLKNREVGEDVINDVSQLVTEFLTGLPKQT